VQPDECQIIVREIYVEKCKTQVFGSYNVFFWALPADVQEIEALINISSGG
jgi:hypothetical protein